MSFKVDFRSLLGKAADYFFAKALTEPGSFHGAARPILHGHAGGDIARARALAVEALRDHLHVVRENSHRFLQQYDDRLSFDIVRVSVAGHWVTPVGTACGLDADADGLVPLSCLFGFQMPGPVTELPCLAEAMPFQEDARRENLFVPPVVASRGLRYVVQNLRQYRDEGGTAVILPGVVARVSDGEPLDDSVRQLERMLNALAPLVNGFVWTPQYTGVRAVFQPEEFAQTARVMAQAAPGHLKLVELPAWDAARQAEWMALVAAFLTSGGDGVVAVSGREVNRDRLPSPDDWPYEQAILCGADIASFRQRAVAAVRREFPSAFIAACGGIHRGAVAFEVCQNANVIAENEAFTRYGPGLGRTMLKRLANRIQYLQRHGLTEAENLVMYQQRRWQGLDPEACDLT